MIRSVFAFFALFAAMPAMAETITEGRIRADVPGPVISRYIYGQFAEHLGRGVYEGIWVGPDSPIPNTRGIRNDVVAALRAIKVPVVRWPGGCFADEYHWRDGIGKPNDRVIPDIDVSGFPSAEVVSRSHASIRIEGDNYYIEDLGSANGTYINHNVLAKGNRHLLHFGDRISLGKGDLVTFVFQSIK